MIFNSKFKTCKINLIFKELSLTRKFNHWVHNVEIWQNYFRINKKFYMLLKIWFNRSEVEILQKLNKENKMSKDSKDEWMKKSDSNHYLNPLIMWIRIIFWYLFVKQFFDLRETLLLSYRKKTTIKMINSNR